MVMSQRPDPDTPETAASASRGRRGLVGAVVDSLPGQLLMVTIGVIAIGVALVYFPAAAGFSHSCTSRLSSSPSQRSRDTVTHLGLPLTDRRG